MAVDSESLRLLVNAWRRMLEQDGIQQTRRRLQASVDALDRRRAQGHIPDSSYAELRKAYREVESSVLREQTGEFTHAVAAAPAMEWRPPRAS